MKNNKIDILLGNIIKDARIEKKYTLEDIRIRLGIKEKSTIGNYEHGRRSMSIDTLIKVCNILDLDYKEVLDQVASIVK